MQKNIHPASHPIKLILTDGSIVEVDSTYGTPGAEIRLDVDPLKHPAWNKNSKNFINEEEGKIAKFKAKFGIVNLTKVDQSSE